MFDPNNYLVGQPLKAHIFFRVHPSWCCCLASVKIVFLLFLCAASLHFRFWGHSLDYVYLP